MNINTYGKTLLAEHCSFRIGGKAKFFTEPTDVEELVLILKVCRQDGLIPIIFGFGANILFPDVPPENHCYISMKRISGLSYSLCGYNDADEDSLSLLSGTPLSLLAFIGALIGVDLSFTYLLPGSIGAAVYMNARYMDREMNDIVSKVHYIDLDALDQGVKTISANECGFSYKRSIFQDRPFLITAVDIEIKKEYRRLVNTYNTEMINITNIIRDNSLDICNINKFNELFRRLRKRITGSHDSSLLAIEQHRDRYKHFDFPSAGSVFENSRVLGKPIGQLIDELGLKGSSCGDACISPFHGNIIINRGKAKAAEVLKLIDIMTDRIFKAYCFEPKLELKII